MNSREIPKPKGRNSQMDSQMENLLIGEDHSLIIQQNFNICFRQNHEETSMEVNQRKKEHK